MICRCHGIHTTGIVARVFSMRKSSGAMSSTRTMLLASITISCHGVSRWSRRTRLPKTSSKSWCEPGTETLISWVSTVCSRSDRGLRRNRWVERSTGLAYLYVVRCRIV